MIFRKSPTRAEANRLDAFLSQAPPCRRQAPAGLGASPLLAMVATARRLETLRPVPPLPAAALRSSRSAFLAQANRMRALSLRPVPLAPLTPAGRLARAFARLKTLLHPPLPQRRFAPGLAAVFMTLVLIAAGGLSYRGLGMLARTSLPGDTLYAYKLAQEDLDLARLTDSTQRIALHLELAENRSEEIFDLMQAGRPASPETVARLEQHFEAALVTASQLPDPQMELALEQIFQASQNSQLLLAQAQGLAQDQQSRLTLAGAASALNTAGYLAETGLEDPHNFRVQMDALLLLPTGTPVNILPAVTSLSFNPPVSSPTPPATGLSASPTSTVPTATQIPFATPTATRTPDNPPTIPATPSATNVAVGVTALPPTASPTPTPTATRTSTPTATQSPEQPPTETPTQIVPAGDG